MLKLLRGNKGEKIPKRRRIHFFRASWKDRVQLRIDNEVLVRNYSLDDEDDDALSADLNGVNVIERSCAEEVFYAIVSIYEQKLNK